MVKKNIFTLIIILISVTACNTNKKQNEIKATVVNKNTSKKVSMKGTFGNDFEFLKQHKNVITLEVDHGKSKVLVIPEYQGRVMTSTSNGFEGNSYGWLNYKLIESGVFEKHINVFGGEDRFWIGPEGGQYSIFFKNGDDFTFKNWFTPKEIDTEPFELVSQSRNKVSFKKRMELTNYADYTFDIEVNRSIIIIEKSEIEKELGISINNKVDYVGYMSDNEIVNTGKDSWKKETGLLSIWILGMYMPSQKTTVVLPYKNELALNTSYFGTIPPNKLNITDKHVMYKGDGSSRFKLGLPPKNVMPYIGSFDSKKQVLTIVSYTFKGDTTYVSSEWRMHKKPYAGDVINSYNDGPLETGSQLGPFYELESSSNTRELNSGESLKHIHKTYHFEGDFDALNDISKKLLKKDLKSL